MKAAMQIKIMASISVLIFCDLAIMDRNALGI